MSSAMTFVSTYRAQMQMPIRSAVGGNMHNLKFEDLPPEVRNEIYMQIFYLDNEHVDEEQSESPFPVRDRSHLNRVYNPYLVWVKPKVESRKSKPSRMEWQ